ncbi:NADH:ubiquinone reductase (Na(+)-transporting) subunit C [Algoriphagus aestuariicola]|uniref:Na(+)-translocating NADH-quinone reductase subunit C n=1 Tax=Algoriphagus aestuariicola TaxID=1852016 RepID=A0ABS3BSC1_9BACT|nr:NADH:ubiquinone reductase (Na(+)-transporting) subunit C [Algoriphagus aestuariicola]MBN7801739.1 NADH:ubiquinone reductase (Na(+)-transporting) subunit C [Algoriphagus aestuariicola]
MQQSNTYVIVYSAVLTIILGLLLSGSAQILGPRQQKAIALDKKKQILGAVISAEEIGAMTPDQVNEFYENNISSIVVDINGKEITDGGVTAEKVEIAKDYKKPADQRSYPVFIYHAEGNPSEVKSYILPLYGAGLWDAIWGYIALETDMNTVAGITLAHAGETPGLGARITEGEVQARYVGKKIFDESGELVAVEMMKGEGKDYSTDDHKVDGMSGATITGNGVNNMLKAYLSHYEAYIKGKSQTAVAGL